jgi:hypothetical protein
MGSEWFHRAIDTRKNQNQAEGRGQMAEGNKELIFYFTSDTAKLPLPLQNLEDCTVTQHQFN